jgi:hypothetical protein
VVVATIDTIPQGIRTAFKSLEGWPFGKSPRNEPVATGAGMASNMQFVGILSRSGSILKGAQVESSIAGLGFDPLTN